MARTSYKRSSRPTGRKGPNAVGNLHTGICKGDPRDALRPRMTIKKKAPEDDREETPGSSPRVTVVKKSPRVTVVKKSPNMTIRKKKPKYDRKETV